MNPRFYYISLLSSKHGVLLAIKETSLAIRYDSLDVLQPTELVFETHLQLDRLISSEQPSG